MREFHISIVGLGPRGLIVLECLGRLVRQYGGRARFVVHTIDPNSPGQGSHSWRQPDHLLTNTLASQVTLFPLNEPDNPSAGNSGPSFTQWARSAGYRRHADRCFPTDATSGDELSDADYLPRCMLGEYLTWCYNKMLGEMPDAVRHVHYRQCAVDMIREAGSRWIIRLANGFTIRSDFVFMTTGHCVAAPSERDILYGTFAAQHASLNWRLAYIKTPYPIDRLAQIDPGSAVAVQGLGLTAHDVISELTVGRGGRFVSTKRGLEYRRSGAEPRLLLFSRHSLPAAARGINQKGVAGRHHARFFTPEAIHGLRETARREDGVAQLDFRRDVLPLIKKEMCWAWRLTQGCPADAQADFTPSAGELAAIEEILDPLRNRRFNDLDAFRNFMISFIKDDLAEARKGNQGSPTKAGTDVIRDARDALGAAVEHRGLEPESHRFFVEDFVPLMNRISFGPPLRRNEELLALIDAGILDWAGGPGAHVVPDPATGHFVVETVFDNGVSRSKADVLITARLDAFRPETDASAFTRNLMRRGLIRPHFNGRYHPGGLDVDRDGHPIARDGLALRDVWVLGYPTEGVHFYTHALPRPLRSSGQFAAAEKCLRQMLDDVTAAPGQYIGVRAGERAA